MGQNLKVRKPEFVYPEDLEVCWNPSLKEFACVANSISLLMPYLEPYVVKSVAAARAEMRSANLLDDQEDEAVRSYLGQETQHHLQHERYNEFLVEKYPKLRIWERLAARLAKRLLRKRSVEYNLAQSLASESFAYSVARWCSEHSREIFTGSDPVVGGLFRWHLAEEVEHKSIVFELWSKFPSASRFKYKVACIVSVITMAAFVISSALVMMAYEKKIFHPMAWVRLTKWAVTFAFELLPTLTISTLKGFHPDQLVDPIDAANWLKVLDTDSTLRDTGVNLVNPSVDAAV